MMVAAAIAAAEEYKRAAAEKASQDMAKLDEHMEAADSAVHDGAPWATAQLN